MLKALRSSSCLQQARFTTGASYLQSNPRHGVKLSSPFHGVLRTVLANKNPNLVQRVFFCSDSSDKCGSDTVSAIEEAESNSAAAIVPTAIKKPDDFLTVVVLALPLPHRPLFPGFYMPIYVKMMMPILMSFD
ncbi:hypothetical protein L1987_70985 [Smallanthus sonchifolius]|uniref:Uncharacterized protein n=1 Tax=Smallanthus sonchifolius TaxID=185202 RepID=A0ACB9AQU8_9ASTR|nr:hypothetical protein L1987_70985 [Smallanthus sonchifolius]